MSNLSGNEIDTPGLNIGLDLDRNDFICWETTPTDKLSTIPSYGLDPMDYFNWKTTNILGGVSISPVSASSLYGNNGIRVTCDTTNSNGVIIGKDSVPSFNFTGLTNGRVYTVQIAVRRSALESNGSRPMRLQFRVQSDGLTKLNVDFDLAVVDTWYIVRGSFTANGTDSNLCLRVFKNGLAATAITYDISGIMIFNETAAVAQQGFNVGTTLSLHEKINRRVITSESTIGMRPYERTGDENVATLVCNNDDRFFSQEYTSSIAYGTLLPYTVVLIRYGTQRLYLGYLETCKPSPFLYGDRKATLTCFGLKRYMEKAPADIEYAESQRVDLYMRQILEDFDSNITYGNLQNSQTTLAYYGDNAYDDKNEQVSVYDAFKQLNNLEQGWFFINADGEPEFFDRHETINAAIDFTVDNTAQGFDYAPIGEYMINRCKVKVYPRAISGVATDILFQFDQSQVIRKGTLRRFRIPYTDSSGNMIGAKDVATPGGADFVSSGGSPFLTINKYGQFSRITIDNTTGTTDCTVSTLILRGRKITYLNPIEVVAENATAIANYGVREMVLDMKGLKDVNEGDDLANFVILMRSQLRGDVKSISLSSYYTSANADTQRAMVIGSNVRCIDDQVSHDEVYFIVGVSHRYEENGMLHSKYNLEIVAGENFWILGHSALDTTTVLGY